MVAQIKTTPAAAQTPLEEAWAWNPYKVAPGWSPFSGNYDPGRMTRATTQGMSQLLRQGGGLPQAFSPRQLQGLYTMGKQNLMTGQRQAMAGIGAASRARGEVGPNIGALFGQQMNDANAGALAKANLEAQVAGMEKGNAFMGTLGNIRQNELTQQQQREMFGEQATMDRLKSSSQEAEGRSKIYLTQADQANQGLIAAQQAANNYLQQYGAQLTTKAAKGKDFAKARTRQDAEYESLLDAVDMWQKRTNFWNDKASRISLPNFETGTPPEISYSELFRPNFGYSKDAAQTYRLNALIKKLKPAQLAQLGPNPTEEQIKDMFPDVYAKFRMK